MPETPLRHWPSGVLPSGKAPRLLRSLPGGRSNASYLVEADGALWVLRINAAHPLPGVDRIREARVLEAAVSAGLAPEVLHCNPESGVLISHYLDGRHWQAGDLEDKGRRNRLLKLIQGVSRLALVPPPLDYREHINHYLVQIEDRHIQLPQEIRRTQARLIGLLKSPARNSASLVMTHHDLTPENIIEYNGRLFLLDWEYAATGPAAMDLAVLAREWRLEPEVLAGLRGMDTPAIKSALALYDHMCSLWRLLNLAAEDP